MNPSHRPAVSGETSVRRVHGSRRAVLPGAPGADPTPQESIEPVRAAEDTDAPWGARDRDSNDDQLKRDVPPHWG
ncbi:MAG: hypothetical protein ABWX65_02150 [Mycetocola sp.]